MLACCFGYLLQAIVVNVSPILFITLKEQFMLSFSQLGFLVLANFVTQLVCDLLFGGLIDRYGFRPFALGASVLSALGFAAFAMVPCVLPQNPYPGFLLATMLFAAAGGLLEVLLSPIVNALPLSHKKKATMMGLVHSAYSWGQIMTVLFTTFLLFLLGPKRWQWIYVIWCIVPVIVFVMFLKAPLAPGVPPEKQQNAKNVFLSRSFALCMVLMVAGGAGELIIGQWSSSFLEKGLGVSKAVGDIAGVCAFAAAMGIGRTIYSKFGENWDIHKLIYGGLWILFFCYLAVGLFPGRIVPLVAIAVSGLGVAITWPGTLLIAAECFPYAGSWMFALLAAGGDIGTSFGPWLTGKVMDVCAALPALDSLAQSLCITGDQLSMRGGLLIGALFPLVGIIAHGCLKKTIRK